MGYLININLLLFVPGTGCARGFLSAFDAGWMIRDWCLGKKNPLKILAEREMTRYSMSQF